MQKTDEYAVKDWVLVGVVPLDEISEVRSTIRVHQRKAIIDRGRAKKQRPGNINDNGNERPNMIQWHIQIIDANGPRALSTRLRRLLVFVQHGLFFVQNEKF